MQPEASLPENIIDTKVCVFRL